MKATEIFNQSIVAHNPAIDDSLDPKVIESLCAHNDRLSYDYERLYNSGKLLKLLKSPKKRPSPPTSFAAIVRAKRATRVYSS